MFNFKKDRLKKGASLGYGSFGEVFPYQKNPEDTKWVVKRTKARKIEELLRCLPEIVLGFSCDHPCIVPVKGYSIQPKDNKYDIHMKLPRMMGGNLADELRKRRIKNLYYSESELVKHFYSLVSAVDYLHNKKIFHGDIKINNVLLDGKGDVKLSDIGSAKYVPDEDLYNSLTGAQGAENYKAPEIIQHEKAFLEYNLKDEEERKAYPMENILKKDKLFLADSWSLGLTVLEICMLQSRFINPRDPVPVIEETLQKVHGEARKRYQDSLLGIVFGLLRTDPAQRLQVSVVKEKLEENFQHILTEEVKASFDSQKPSKQENSGISNKYFEIFNERTHQILKEFEDEKKVKERKLNTFQESINQLQRRLSGFHVEIEKIKSKKNQEVEEVSKKYEKIIQDLKQENLNLLEKLERENLERKPRNLEALKESIIRVSTGLNPKWKRQAFYIIQRDYLSIIQNQSTMISDQILTDFIEDLVQACSKEDLWKNLDGLDINIDGNNSITDEGLKALALNLGPQLSNLQHFALNMYSWNQVTDEGLKQLASQLSFANIKHLELIMIEWSQITDSGIIEFARQLGSQLGKIEHLKLVFRKWTQVTDEGLKGLAYYLSPILPNIKHLELYMGMWDQITDEGLKEFARQFGPKLSNIQHLDLDMTGWNKITDEGLKEFACQIGPKIANIEYLWLGMGEWNKITDEGLSVLITQFGSQLTNVKNLTLGMWNWNQITDGGLKMLSLQLLPQLASVQRLVLGIGNWQITDEGFKLFASQFRSQFANLESLVLAFPISKVTAASLDVLTDQIVQNLPKLIELEFDLCNYSPAFKSTKNNLEKQLKNIPKVTIYEYE